MLDDELLHKWVNGSLTTEELEVFKTRPEYDSLVLLYQKTEHLSIPALEEETMLAEILKQKKEKIVDIDTGKRRFLSTWMKYAIAASVLILATWFFWPASKLVHYQLAKGEKKEGVLPDQSMFALNAESTLSYDEKLWAKDRSLDLRGEAFFSVKPGSKFMVKTSNGSVQVLGTQFNVWSRDGVLVVKCETGKVAILSTEGKVLDELNPKDAIRVEQDQVADKWELQSGTSAHFDSAVSSFKNAKLSTVLKNLEDRYSIRIEGDGINLEERISCNFQYENLDLALKSCLLPLGITYHIESNTKVVLKKK